MCLTLSASPVPISQHSGISHRRRKVCDECSSGGKQQVEYGVLVGLEMAGRETWAPRENGGQIHRHLGKGREIATKQERMRHTKGEREGKCHEKCHEGEICHEKDACMCTCTYTDMHTQPEIPLLQKSRHRPGGDRVRGNHL